MTFASITARTTGTAKAVNPSAVLAVEDKGDGTASITFVDRPAFDTNMSAAAIVAALGLTMISITRSGAPRATAFNPANIIAVEPWTNPATSGAGCQLRLAGGAQFASDTALATVLALLDPAATISVTRVYASVAGAVTRSYVMTVDPHLNAYSGVLGSVLHLRDGHVIETNTSAAAILAALNA